MSFVRKDVLAALPEPPPSSTANVQFSDVFILDAMCINCNEMIQLESMEEHSRIWTQVTNDVMSYDELDTLKQHRNKLDKLLENLDHLQLDEKLPLGDRNYISLLAKFVTTVLLAEKTWQGVEAIYHIIEWVESISHTYSGSRFVYIYIQRVKFLINQIYHTMNAQLNNYQHSEIERLKNVLKENHHIVWGLRENKEIS